MNSLYYETLFTLFFIIAALIILDRNVGDLIYYRLLLVWINIQRAYWLVRMHPANFITTWIIKRKLKKLLDEQDRRRTVTDDEDES